MGDILLLYGALFVMLAIRYGSDINNFIVAHIGPFSIVFVFWIILFYIVGLYDLQTFREKLTLAQNIIIGVGVGVILAVVIFYLVPYFQITPKTNLVIFAAIFIVLELGWRMFFATVTKVPQKRAMIIGGDHGAEEMEELTIKHPHLGYKIAYHVKNFDQLTPERFNQILDEFSINAVITMRQLEPDDMLFDAVYHAITRGVEVVEFSAIYEALFQKVPVSEIKHMWVLMSVSKQRRLYSAVKRPTEFLFALVLFFILLIPMLLIGLLVMLTSRGSALYLQKRVGKNNKIFTLYKFRTMRKDAEKDGAQWAQNHDPRVTFIGRILRFTHLDELPQIINVVSGSLSFVGPRPERPEFVRSLEKNIPYYEVRHLIKPGITGWAQVNYRYGSSIEDTYKKLQYDMYYLKHRSFALDMLIILRTIKMFLFNYS